MSLDFENALTNGGDYRLTGEIWWDCKLKACLNCTEELDQQGLYEQRGWQIPTTTIGLQIYKMITFFNSMDCFGWRAHKQRIKIDHLAYDKCKN